MVFVAIKPREVSYLWIGCLCYSDLRKLLNGEAMKQGGYEIYKDDSKGCIVPTKSSIFNGKFLGHSCHRKEGHAYFG